MRGEREVLEDAMAKARRWLVRDIDAYFIVQAAFKPRKPRRGWRRCRRKTFVCTRCVEHLLPSMAGCLYLTGGPVELKE